MFVFGDVGGEFQTLLKLLSYVDDKDLVCLGDPNDRGLESDKVIEFLRNNSKIVYSNHADMFISYYEKDFKYYSKYDFEDNGGITTLESYIKNNILNIPTTHINYLKHSPMFIERNEFIFSHAPINYNSESFINTPFIHWTNEQKISFVWNRWVPFNKLPFLNNKINIFGHNSGIFPKIYSTRYPTGINIQNNDDFQDEWNNRKNNPIHAICLDTSQAKILTGLDITNMALYQQEFIYEH